MLEQENLVQLLLSLGSVVYLLLRQHDPDTTLLSNPVCTSQDVTSILLGIHCSVELLAAGSTWSNSSSTHFEFSVSSCGMIPFPEVPLAQRYHNISYQWNWLSLQSNIGANIDWGSNLFALPVNNYFNFCTD